MRGAVAVGQGTGTGLTARTIAAKGGEETHILSIPVCLKEDIRSAVTVEYRATRKSRQSPMELLQQRSPSMRP
jgi:hypothetical protein